MIISENSALL